MNTILIDDFGPIELLRPATVAEVSDKVRSARESGRAIYPVGGRTMLDFGLPPGKPGIALDLTGLDRIIDYPARDMTITVQAGITIAKLQQALAAENQWLPVDVPHPDLATLGGAIACNASGPRRFGHGTLRDYVIGISAVNDHGEEVKAGGRVVKNVAGYDMMKLFTGSHGTLGIISQVTLKVKPKPGKSALCYFKGYDSNAEAILAGLAASKTRPVALEILNAAAVRAIGNNLPAIVEGDWLFIVGYEDNIEAVNWQLETIRQELPESLRAGFTVVADGKRDSFWNALRDFQLLPRTLSFKSNLRPSSVSEFCRAVSKIFGDIPYQSHTANGIVRGHFPDGTSLETAKTGLAELLRVAVSKNGNLVLPRCCTAWKSELPVWGFSTPDRKMMAKIKDALDPGKRFNPGRFVDGI